jgi:hypothetical protein
VVGPETMELLVNQTNQPLQIVLADSVSVINVNRTSPVQRASAPQSIKQSSSRSVSEERDLPIFENALIFEELLH